MLFNGINLGDLAKVGVSNSSKQLMIKNHKKSPFEGKWAFVNININALI